MNKSVLVTGATGFIGSRLVDSLIKKDYNTVSLVRKGKKSHLKSKSIIGDLTKKETLCFDDDFEAVYHLGALTPLEKNKKLLKETNYEGTKNLFDAVKDKTKSFVYVSGLAVFDSNKGIITEETAKNSNIEFVKIRLDAQNFLAENCKELSINFSTVHLADIVYGNGGFFKSMIIDRLQNKTFRIPGKGEYFKNFIHVDDVVNAMVTIVEKNLANTTYIITDSQPTQFREFINYTADKIGTKHPGTVPLFLAKLILGGETMDLLTRSTKASNEKIRKIYEFQYPSYKQGVDAVTSNL